MERIGVYNLERQGLIFTNDNCICCNKCLKVCTSPGASYLSADAGISAVHIDAARCISCGACFAQCEHHARGYRDDTAAFFQDLEKGTPISVLFAPSFLAAYPEEYASILGGLRALGVRRLIPVSFGADICTWAYLKYMREENFQGGISTTCPVVVSYVEHCRPELIPLLIPVQSPLLCAAIYCREELGITDRLAFLGPCIGKKLETGMFSSKSPVSYNVTFLKLMEYVRTHNVYGPDASGEIEYGLGSFYPAPGGLAENIRWFLGDDANIRIVSGHSYLYDWLTENAHDLLAHENPFLLIDALNCQDGCVEGTATEGARFKGDRMLCALHTIKRNSRRTDAASPWNAALSPEARLENLNRQFQRLSLARYLRGFTDRSAHCQIRIPSEEEAEEIFISMHKTTEDSRRIDCSTCGYRTCRELMIAIYNRFNSKRSCIYYEKEEALRLERLSFCDQLTSVMNRTALARTEQGLIYHSKPIAIMVADVNGLKEVNDTQGHDAGDRLIVTVASTLASVFGRENVFRIGGDEFLIIMQDHTEEECRRGIQDAERLLDARGASAAMGYAFRSHLDDSGYSALKERADRDMYRSKDEYYRRTGKKRR